MLVLQGSYPERLLTGLLVGQLDISIEVVVEELDAGEDVLDVGELVEELREVGLLLGEVRECEGEEHE